MRKIAAMMPQEVGGIDISFPAKVSHLMPKYEDIPKEFKDGHTKWNDFFRDSFYCGISDLKLCPKAGIDPQKAIRHVRSVMGSFEPKHEHKEAAVAYLMSLWFEDATWQRGKRK